MKQAHELLYDLKHTKRASCLSEYDSWFADIVEYLEAQVKHEPIEEVVSQYPIQLSLDFPPFPRVKITHTGA